MYENDPLSSLAQRLISEGHEVVLDDDEDEGVTTFEWTVKGVSVYGLLNAFNSDQYVECLEASSFREALAGLDGGQRVHLLQVMYHLGLHLEKVSIVIPGPDADNPAIRPGAILQARQSSGEEEGVSRPLTLPPGATRREKPYPPPWHEPQVEA